MDIRKRVLIISKIVSMNPGGGKTAIMKYIYLLQKVYKLSMGYDYSIYTYGPYSSEVMEDIDFANNMAFIKVERYNTGAGGYRITPDDGAARILSEEEAVVPEYEHSIQAMLDLFGDKSARDLELLNTIIYIYSNFKENNWDMEGVQANVHEIKPYFDVKVISEEYNWLDSQGILEKSIS